MSTSLPTLFPFTLGKDTEETKALNKDRTMTKSMNGEIPMTAKRLGKGTNLQSITRSEVSEPTFFSLNARFCYFSIPRKPRVVWEFVRKGGERRVSRVGTVVGGNARHEDAIPPPLSSSCAKGW